jgi:hypothetical protein
MLPVVSKGKAWYVLFAPRLFRAEAVIEPHEASQGALPKPIPRPRLVV